MKSCFKDILRNISYSFSANFLSLMMSLISFLVVPKTISVVDYGAWQLYNFYLSFVGFFHFGWIDGIYLRFGGKDYSELDKKLLAGQYYALGIFELIIATTVIISSDYFTKSEFAINALRMVSVVGVFVILTTFSNFVLQFTNRIKDYAKLISYERVIFFVATMIYVLFGYTSYIGLLWISFATRLMGFFYSIYLVRDIAFSSVPKVKDIVKEIYANISVGSKLMLANIASILLLGIIRFGISQEWDMATFGKVSLALGISNFLMIFINAVSVVLFPILKRVNQEVLPRIYLILRNVLSALLLGMLILYYPLKMLLILWLPKYEDSLIYMAVLFPLCLFESKVALLINTYLKSMRQERLMLRINWISVIISFFAALVAVVWLHDLDLTIFSIVIVFAFRCALAEYFLGQLLKIELRKDILLELIMVILFIFSSWVLNSWLSLILYVSGYFIYLILKKKDILASIGEMKEISKK